MSAASGDTLHPVAQATRDLLIEQLEQLKAYTHKIGRELTALSPTEREGPHMTHASEQLGAVVDATEVAANQIMDACDTLQQIALEIGGAHASFISAAVSTIYDACGFQDLTGQRIVKVTRTLNIVESGLGNLMRMLGVPDDSEDPLAADSPVVHPTRLLNGPQLPGSAMEQSLVDTLLAKTS